MTVDGGGNGRIKVDAYGGSGGSTLTIGGNLTNTSTGSFGDGGVSVGNAAMSNADLLTVNGSYSNTGGLTTLNGGNVGAATAQMTITGAAPSTLLGTYDVDANKGGAALQWGSGGITQIGDGGSNAGALTLDGANAYAEIGATNSNSALTGLTTIASNGLLDLRDGASVTTSGAVTVNGGSGYVMGRIKVDAYGGAGGSTLTVNGNLTNTSTGSFGDGGVSVGNAAMTSSGALIVQGGLDNVSGALLGAIGSSSNPAAQGQVIVNGGDFANSGTVDIGTNGIVTVNNLHAYNQTGGITTLQTGGQLVAQNVIVAGGTLQGDGTVNGTVYNGATITGGIANGQPGTLTVNGNFNNGGASGVGPVTTPGVVASTLNASGNTQITVTGGHQVQLLGGTVHAIPNGVTYAAGQTYTVMNFIGGSLYGLFGSVQNGTGTPIAGTYTNLGGGLTLGVVYNDHAGNIQLQVVNTPGSTAEIWNGGTGTWGTAAQWSAGVPTFYSDVTIGATASGDVTLGQDATVSTLAINAGNTLQYQASLAQTLTVGGNVTVATGGTLSLPTSGDKLNVGGNLSNGGTTTLGAGANALGLGTFTNTGTGGITIGSGAQLSTLGAATNQSGGTVTLAGGTLQAPSYANAGTTQGNGTVVPAIANTGQVTASGGTLVAANGIQGSSGNVTVNTGATLDLSQSTSGSSAANLTVNGSLSLGTQNITVSTDYNNANFGTGNAFDARANVTGSGQIDAAGNVAQSVTGAQVTNGTSTNPTLAFGNVHVDTTNNANYQVNNAGTSGPSLRGAIQTSVNGGNITDASLTGTGVTAQNYGPVATGGSTGGYTVTWAPTAAGALSGQAVHVANNFANVGEQTMAITGAAYAYASPTITSALTSPFNFGVVQVGQTYTDQLTVANTLTASNAAYQEGLNASFGTVSDSQLTTNGGTITNLAAGASNNTAMSVTLTPVSAGALSGTVQVNLASNGAGTSGLGITSLTSQNLGYSWQFSGTVVNQATPSITPTTIDFGNVRIGTTQTKALTVTNIAGTPPQASLDAQLASGTTGAATSNAGTINQLAAGSNNSTSLVVGLNTTVAGHQTGSASIALQSDSTPNGCTSNCIVDLTGQNISVSGNVFRLASGSAATPVDAGAVRVGGTLSGAIAVTNTAANDGSSENLDASSGSATGNVTATSGTVTGLGAQQTNASAIGATLDSSSAGVKSGTVTVAFQSDGTGIDNGAPVSVGSQQVTVNGKVYTPAAASVATTTVDFGIVHVGDGGGTLSKGVTVGNGAATTALNDVLVGSISAGGTPFSGSGTLGVGLGAGQSSSTDLNVDLATGTAGSYSGAANLALASHDADLADLALTTSPITLSAQVNNYACAAFGFASGSGGVSGSSSCPNDGSQSGSYTLDLGNLIVGSGSFTGVLNLLNDTPLAQQLFTDDLAGTFSITSGSGIFTLGSLFSGPVSGIAGGTSLGGLDVSFDASNLGSFSELLSFDAHSTNTGGFNGDLGKVSLLLTANVVSSAAAPEPGSLALLMIGAAALGFASRRGARRAAQPRTIAA
ncbi:MAG: choice-of-anchor D domain-containing protein [Proteobacteria bacterium]|nr:choice-of-anchor D domain-containing protein [Pseudomonadota bacterium]